MTDRPSHPVLAVSACLTDGEQVLLVERGRPPLAGRLSLPGGRVRLGERLEAAARREIEEETGLVPAALHFVTVHEVIDPRIHAVIHVFAGPLGDTAPIAGDDAAAVRIMPHSEIAAAEARGETTADLAEIIARAMAAGTVAP